MGLRTFTNTRYFSEAANDFKKNNGVYTRAPKGSKDYKEYWAEQKKRCLAGYSVGDLKITGRHYFYLNFCPIKKSEKKEAGSWNVMKPKELLFPSFWEIDYNWWWSKEIAMYGMLEDDVRILGIDGLPIKNYTEGKHLSCVKTRRAGFSYKEAADGVFNYNFIPNSKSYYFAAKKPYLDEDGILNKVTDYLNHLDTNTQDFWRRNRMAKDTMMHRKASYYDKNKDERGYKSEIIGVIIDDPNKVRGKDGIKITYEEAGSFKNLKAALAISMPSVRDGATMTGQISVFGTGGEEGEDIEGLEDIFLEPEAYDMLEFHNIWSEGQEDTVCGYFVPCTHANQDFMDEDGNIDLKGALEYDDKERDKKKKMADPKNLDRRVAEFPRTPEEALNRLSNNIFPIAEAQACLRYLEHNKDEIAALRHGILYMDKKKGVIFEPREDAKPIVQFPHKNNDDLTGCVTIAEPPIKNEDGQVDSTFYEIVVDPYYKDQAEDRTSLWSARVLAHKVPGNPNGGKEVAWYTGRPASLETCYRTTMYLSMLYNGKIQSEIAGGGQGLFDFLKTNRQLHRVAFAPESTINKETAASKNRQYFMNLSTDEKKNGLSYYADWLTQIRGIREDGSLILNIHTEKDVALLREIIKFDPNPKKNFDRISARIVGMFQMKALEIDTAKDEDDTNEIESFMARAVGSDEDYDYDQNNGYYSLDDMLEP